MTWPKKKKKNVIIFLLHINMYFQPKKLTVLYATGKIFKCEYIVCWTSFIFIYELKICTIIIKCSFSSVQSLSHVLLCDPMNCSTTGLPVCHQLLEFTQTHVHWVGDAIQLSHPLSSPSPPALSLSQHQGLFKWVSSSHQVATVVEFQLQHQSFQWTLRTNLL